MYNRIIKTIKPGKLNSDGSISGGGSDDLPDIITINNIPLSWNDNTANISTPIDQGIIGDNTQEFIIDFPSYNASGAWSDHKTPLSYYTYMMLIDLLTKPSEKFAKNYFDRFLVFSIEDYGIQTMTALNYEMQFKIFDAEGEMINPYRVALLRSYTSKKAYALVDVSGDTGQNEILSTGGNQSWVSNLKSCTIVIDFGNRLFDTKNEGLTKNTDGTYVLKSRYFNINGYPSNLSSYLGEKTDSSPYYDTYMLDKSTYADDDHKNTVLAKQNSYFQYIADEIMANSTTLGSLYDSTNPVNNINNSKVSISTELAGGDTPTLSIKTLKPEYITDDSAIDFNIGNEVYYFGQDDNNTIPLYGKRILKSTASTNASNDITGTATSSKTFYLVYYKRPDLIHYIFKTTGTIAAGSVASALHHFMNANHYYLNNYDFDNTIAIFNADGLLKTETGAGGIIDLYLPVLADGQENNIKDIDTAETNYTLISDETSYINSSILKYDPSAISSQDTYESGKTYLPYLKNDPWVSDILTANEIYLDASGLTISQVRVGEIANAAFDIRTSGAVPTITTIITTNDYGAYEYRKPGAINTALNNLYNNEILNKNFAKLIPANAEVKSLSAGNSITTTNDPNHYLDYLAIGVWHKGHLKVTIKEDNDLSGDNNIPIENTFYLTKPVSETNGVGLYIIPCLPHYSSISFADDVQYYGIN
jgi:hypothetical protein